MIKPGRVKRVLVTGGAGFIGSHLVDRLVAEGYEVSVLDDLSRGDVRNISNHVEMRTLRFVRGDIRDSRKVNRLARDVDAIVHEAAIVDVETSMKSPTLVNEVNVSGTVNLLDAARRFSVKRFVYASSCAVYGEAKRIPISENAQLQPTSPYGASKLAAERYCLAFHRAYGLETVCLRYFNVFGPRQRVDQYAGVISRFITDLRSGRRPTIFGSGGQVRDFVSVTDAVTATVLALRAGGIAGEVFNVGTGNATSVTSLLHKLEEVSGLRSIRPKHHPPRQGDIRRSVADITQAKTRLRYTPATRLERDLGALMCDNRFSDPPEQRRRTADLQASCGSRVSISNYLLRRY